MSRSWVGAPRGAPPRRSPAWLAQARRHALEAARVLYQLAHEDDPDRGAGEQAWLIDRHAQAVGALADLYPPEVAHRALADAQERLEVVPPLSAGDAADLLMAWSEKLPREYRTAIDAWDRRGAQG